MWKLCVVDDESNRTMVKLVRADYTIGRAEDSTIRLTERNISRSHARLFRENGAWMLEDRQSFTGSFINGERISGSQSLKHGDTIQLGDYRLDLSDEEAEQAIAEPTLEARAAAAALPDRFIVVQGPDVGAVFPLTEQKLLVGRGEECQIPLDDASVSRVHLEVMRTEHGLMVLDQGSSNGLRINGTDLPSAMLRNGDLLELGDVRLKFVPAGVDDAGTALSDPSALVAEATPPRPSIRSGVGRSSAGVMLFGLGVVTLGVALLFMVLRSGGDEEAPVAANAATPADAPAPPAAEGGNALITEAKALADQGAVVMAHRKLSELPPDSALRQSEEFKDIERRWADEIFRAAEVSPDPAERKRLLERIARTTALDTERRRRAADALAKLEAEDVEAVQIQDLPNSGDPKGRAKIVAAKQQRMKKPTARPSRPLGGAPGEASGDPGTEREPPATASANAEPAEPAPAPSPKPAESAPPKANKPAAQKEAKDGPELIRETPF